ncbi:hypothetical protein ITJ57_13410 [Plantibacter sp. VKM Ac-2880]|uniref:hypothetical protein n=1 Tax=Plantibacter sp. VKM Ac-2880 TaxID=2783827 RepID=UPI00188E99DE|nr:hypothetical protein [Plantibacter sp. VKM Ac-2880]MBF4569762.1 hypothetical protein [Plantibacter sp. VKM Ac-2880]
MVMDKREHGFGVGMQVLVLVDPETDPSTGARVSGVIVAPGRQRAAAFISVWTDRLTTWIVEFDEPFVAPDGSGPHESAEVRETYLIPAPFTEETAPVTV